MIRGLLFFAILTTFAIIAIIFFNVYHNVTTPKISEVLKIKNIPITPAFDINTLEKLNQRKQININLEEEKAQGITSAKRNEEKINNENMEAEIQKTSTESAN